MAIEAALGMAMASTAVVEHNNCESSRGRVFNYSENTCGGEWLWRVEPWWSMAMTSSAVLGNAMQLVSRAVVGQGHKK